MWFRNYAPNERPDRFDRILQSWDTANKASELSDFSVCTSWGLKGKDLYLLHVLRRRMEYPELKRAVVEQAQAFAAQGRVDRGQGLGNPADPGIGRRWSAHRNPLPAAGRQDHAMHAQTAMIENGFVHLPKEAGWLAEYVHELTVFPKGKHDDQVDSTAQMLDWFKRAGQSRRTGCGYSTSEPRLPAYGPRGPNRYR